MTDMAIENLREMLDESDRQLAIALADADRERSARRKLEDKVVRLTRELETAVMELADEKRRRRGLESAARDRAPCR
jgi:hypothetical protein